MAANEEVEEHIHHAQEPFDKLVAGTMAIMAALLAVVSVMGTHFNTEKIVNQQLASDQWAYYQAKDIRRYMASVAQDLSQSNANSAVSHKYGEDANKYRTQTDEIQEKAHDFEKESARAGDKADRLHFGEVFLEIAIVLSSLAILSKRRVLFTGGVGASLVGVLIALTAYWAG